MKTRLDRINLRALVADRVRSLQSGAAGHWGDAFIYLGSASDHPELLEDGLLGDLEERLDLRSTFITLDLGTLPESETPNPLKYIRDALDAWRERRCGPDAHTELDPGGEVRAALKREARDRKADTVWLSWGTAGVRETRPFTAQEAVSWLRDTHSALRSKVPERLKLVCMIGLCVPEGAVRATYEQLEEEIEEEEMDVGDFVVHALDPLSAVKKRDMRIFLQDFQDLGVRQADVSRVVTGMFEGRTTLSYRQALDALERLGEEGTAPFLERASS